MYVRRRMEPGASRGNVKSLGRNSSHGTRLRLRVGRAMVEKGARRAAWFGSLSVLLGCLLLASLAVPASAQATDELQVSLSADRSSPAPLEGAQLAGSVYIFVPDSAGITRVRFFLDDPQMTGSPRLIEKNAPWDFAGTASNGTAKPFDTSALSPGSHIVTAAIDLSNSTTEVVSGTFSIRGLVFDPPSGSFSLGQGETASTQTVLSTNDGAATSFSLSETTSWLSVTPTTGTTPASITVTVDSTGLTEGTYSATVQAGSPGHGSATFSVSLTVGDTGGCSPVACSEILVDAPYTLDFAIDHGKILDGAGIGTGFTYLPPTSNGTGYIPGKLAVDPSSEVLRITTTKGLASGAANSQDNALSIGFDAPSQITRLKTVLVDPPAGTGKFEQAGLWFGNDEDNYIKLVVLSTTSGTVIEALMEKAGSQSGSKKSAVLNLTSSRVSLAL